MTSRKIESKRNNGWEKRKPQVKENRPKKQHKATKGKKKDDRKDNSYDKKLEARKEIDRTTRVSYVNGKPVTAPSTIAQKVRQEAKRGLDGCTTFNSPSNEITAPFVNPNRVVTVPLNARALFGPGIGAAMFAVQRGWAVNEPGHPFAAINYIGRLLLSAALNVTPKAAVVPYWLACIMQALKPKTVVYGDAIIAYSWDTDAEVSTFTLDSTVTNGPLSASANLAFGFIGNGGAVNFNDFGEHGFYPLTLSEYSDEVGALAWSSLNQYLGGASQSQYRRMHEMVPVSKPNKFSDDASAFAVETANPGSAFASSGAPGSRKGLEVPIKTPMLAVFTTNVQSVSVTNRCPEYNVMSGGGPVELGMLCHHIDDNQIRKIRRVIFKQFDFLAWADAVFKSYVAAVQGVIQQADDDLRVIVGDAGIETKLKPLFLNMSILDGQFILRDELLSLLSATQVFCQTLYYDTSNAASFVPFTCTSGTCPLGGGIHMQLPGLLGEIAKSAMSRFLEVPSTEYQTINKTQMDLIVPILGQIYGESLKTSDYFVTVPNSGKQFNIFKVYDASKVPSSPSVLKKKGGNVGAAETSISLIDGSGGDQFYCINTPDALNPRKDEWNSKCKQLSARFQYFGPIGYDAGAFSALGETWYLRYGTTDASKRFNAPSATGYGSNLQVVAKSYRKKPVEAVKCMWPLLYPVVILGGHDDDTAQKIITNIAVLTKEFPGSVVSTSADSVQYSELINAIVDLTTNEIDAEDNAVTVELKRAASKGQGGILSSVLGTLGGAAGNALEGWIGI